MKNKFFSLTLALLTNTIAINAMDIENQEKEPLLKNPSIQNTVIGLDTNQEITNDTQKYTITNPAANALFERIQQEVEKCKESPSNKQITFQELQKILAIKNLAVRNQVINALEIFLHENIKHFSAIKISPEERAKHTKKIKGIINRNTWISGLQALQFVLVVGGYFLTIAYINTKANHSYALSNLGTAITTLSLLIIEGISSVLARINSLELAGYSKAESNLCCGTYLTEKDLFTKTDENQRNIKYNEQLTRFYSMLQNIKLMPLITEKIDEIKKQKPELLDKIPAPDKLIKKNQKEINDLLLQLNAITKKQS